MLHTTVLASVIVDKVQDLHCTMQKGRGCWTTFFCSTQIFRNSVGCSNSMVLPWFCTGINKIRTGVKKFPSLMYPACRKSGIYGNWSQLQEGKPHKYMANISWVSSAWLTELWLHLLSCLLYKLYCILSIVCRLGGDLENKQQGWNYCQFLNVKSCPFLDLFKTGCSWL